jgi:FG-GAP repeat
MNRFLRTAIFATTAIATVSNAQVINEDLKLMADDGAVSDSFGFSIAIDNGVVAVGAPEDDDNGVNSGSAYLFDALTGTQTMKLLPSSSGDSTNFGYSIAIDNNIVAVGSESINANKAYLFDASTGMQLAELAKPPSPLGEYYGHSIAIDGDIVAVGAPESSNGEGSGAVFVFNALSGQYLTTLIPDDGSEDNYFGVSLSIDKGIVAVGAPRDGENGGNSGAVYLFDALSGNQLSKLMPDDGANGDQFGISVALDGSVLAAGSPFDNDPVYGTSVGSAYIFDASTGQQVHKIIPSNPDDFLSFGRSVALQNGGSVNSMLAVGATGYLTNGNNRIGAAYVFNASSATQIVTLLPSVGIQNSFFGRAVTMSSNSISVGAYGDDNGSAYIFDVTGCEADLTGDGELNFFDVSVFLAYFQINNPFADFNGDGDFNFFDVSEFLNAFAVGCP